LSDSEYATPELDAPTAGQRNALLGAAVNRALSMIFELHTDVHVA
jgi:hypothetical protein